ncbi:RNA polymerase sigma factor [Pedobacter endophyticus]|uniref:RNA polymerase sigma-70 region 2 domain-containing protein n=1 Tax=Pedobacter endophyticus TaxID=2789740 RepID=A0A7S9Q072_9SPHI|nr:sigma factor [Pedobacter endophyticus]QPH41093.1 hypothetical protein IZT61_07480 [Pedobacter endophyticus]
MQSLLKFTTHHVSNVSLPTWPFDQQVFVGLLRSQDKKAFALLYKHYAAAIYGMLLNKLNDPVKANKALEDTFLTVWGNLPDYDDKKMRLFTWINQISLGIIKERR